MHKKQTEKLKIKCKWPGECSDKIQLLYRKTTLHFATIWFVI